MELIITNYHVILYLDKLDCTIFDNKEQIEIKENVSGHMSNVATIYFYIIKISHHHLYQYFAIQKN